MLFFAFFTASGLFMPIFASQFLSQLKQILAHRKTEKFPISNEIADLTKRIGGTFKKLGIGEGCNAYVMGKTLVLGIDLIKRFDFDKRQAVVAHEAGHRKERHWLIRALAIFPLLLIPWYSWSKLYSPIFFSESITQIILTVMVSIAFLAYVMVIMIPINWYLEVRADRIAARFVGKESIKSALLALSNRENLEESSESHPSIAERVKLIEKLEF